MNLELLYGKGCDGVAALKRIQALKAEFLKKEGEARQKIYSSSGRAEILGNHTDHNCGKVMVAAVSCDVLACVSPINDKIIIHSEGFEDVVVLLNDLAPIEAEKGSSQALVRGVADGIKKRGHSFGGFKAHVTSNIFKGAGVSSSAAYSVLVAEIINDLYLSGELTPTDKAAVAQYAENVYFGKPCGLLDQSGIAIGSLTALDFKTPSAPAAEKLPAIEGYSLIITNTGGSHAELTPHYAAIREEMHTVARFFNKECLREVEYESFDKALPELKKKFSGRAVLRALHFYNENLRVERAARAVKQRDYKTFLNCVNESGISSLTLLQNCAVPGETDQQVVLGIELSRQIIKDGAVRVHGGGFAGSILAVVANGEADGYVKRMGELFGEENVFVASVREKGTCRVDL